MISPIAADFYHMNMQITEKPLRIPVVPEHIGLLEYLLKIHQRVSARGRRADPLCCVEN